MKLSSDLNVFIEHRLQETQASLEGSYFGQRGKGSEEINKIHRLFLGSLEFYPPNKPSKTLGTVGYDTLQPLFPFFLNVEGVKSVRQQQK